jgi:phosphoglycerate kinase
MNTYCTFPSWQLADQTVFVRCDANVPLKQGTIIDDYRLEQLCQTIDLLLEKKARVTLATHMGRPHGFDEMLSVRHLVPWFTKHGYKVLVGATPEVAFSLRKQHPADTIILLENLRFFPGETTSDRAWAEQLSTLGTYYVNDAFGTLHRNDTSITILPSLYAPTHRSFGLLVQEEIRHLTPLVKDAPRPFVVIIGGAKVSDKLPLINAMLKRADTVAILPAIAHSFLYAQQKQIGVSLVDAHAVTRVQNMLHRYPDTIHLPEDYLIELSKTLRYVSENHIPTDANIVSFGPQTLHNLTRICAAAQTIFFNGAPGFYDRPDTRKETDALLQQIAQSNAYTVIGGGDTIAAANRLKLLEQFSFVSTGGGATLAFLAGEPLPGYLVMQSGKNSTSVVH